MALDNQQQASGSHANAGPSHDTTTGGSPANSHDPTSSNGLVNTQNHSQPIKDVISAVNDMVKRACALHHEDARVVDLRQLAKSRGFGFRVATMCSGTEAPISIIKIIQEMFAITGLKDELFRFHHVFSVEKEPFKQAFILRNTNATVFRDVLDFTGVSANARTAKGGITHIPEDIDVLIAGTSCVDFSSLNTRKKTKFSKEVRKIADGIENTRKAQSRRKKMSRVLDEILGQLPKLGSSEQTFFAMLLYVRRYRPRIVILENVRGAPFDNAKDYWFHGLDYAASFEVLDSKDCYLPQTRERKYLIAVNRDGFSEADISVEQFADIVKKLKRPYSSTVEDFFLADNDPRAQLFRLQAEDHARKKRTRDTQWDFGQLRHDELRRTNDLGRSRPLTGWKEDGTNDFFDRMDKIVMKTQPPRVLDSVDISHLMCLSSKFPFDIRYKTKLVDLSQNIDRHRFDKDFGTVPCITPNGMSWITTQWRFVTGLEALILQGLPIERIDLSLETQEQLLDLAGNAMTTTAVGMVFTAAILCLGGRKLDSGKLLVESFHGNRDYEDLDQPIASTAQFLIPSPGLYPAQVAQYNTTEWKNNMEDVVGVFVRARRYCCCSGSTKYSVKKTKRCQACLVVRCTNCAGNPTHLFEAAMDHEFQPITFQNAERELTRFLPTVIRSLFEFSHAEDERLLQSPLGPIVDKLWTAEFFYQRTYVTEAVTVQYASSAGFVLDGVIKDEGITWYIFLDRFSDLGQRAIQPKTWLEDHCMSPKPIARCFRHKRTTVPSPKCKNWEFWICPQLQDQRAEFQVLKQSIGGRNRITLLYISEQYLTNAVNTTLQELAGDYDHYPECESAEGSLHVRTGSSQLYLFKDPTRVGDIKKDTFVISREHRLLQTHEYREVLAEFAPSAELHKAGLGISPPAEVVLNGQWELMGKWTPVSPPEPVLGDELLFVPPEDRRGSSGLCGSSEWFMFGLEVAPPPTDPRFLMRKLDWLSTQVHGDGWAAVPVHEMQSFFDTFSFALSKAITHIPSPDFNNISSCWEDCSVRLPQVKWYIREQKALPEPLHPTAHIEQYEVALKKQHPVFQAQFLVLHTSDEEKKVHLRFICNYARLAHRAEAVFPPERRAILTEPAQITLRATTHTQQNALLVFPLQPFQKSIRPLKTMEGGVPNYSAFTGTGYDLKPEQMRPVHWMLQQEQEPTPFAERESEEEVIGGLQLRLVGTAERHVTRRGGLVADDIGFGKTVMMLAVVNIQLGFDAVRHHERVLKQEYDGRKALNCSLVIAPSHIVDQWGNEAHKFLKYNLDNEVVLVKKVADLRGRNIAKLMRARLIIVSDTVFATQAYQEPLSFWSGCTYPGQSMPAGRYGKWLADRSYTAWHEDCMACMGEFLGRFLEDDSEDSRTACLKEIEKRHHDREKENKDLSSASIGERLWNKKYTASNEAETTDDDSDDDKPSVSSTTNRKKTRDESAMFYDEQFIFEFFSFNRIIWDEASYGNPTVAQFVASVSAVSKWLLSGTPASQNLADVCSYANALGIHLARPIDLRGGLPSAAQGPSLSTMTPLETIASYGRLKSDEFVKERHSQGQLFLEKFASANMVDRSKFATEHKVVICSPTLSDRAVYQSLQHEISRAEMTVDLLSGDSLRRVYAAVGENKSKSPGRKLAVESLIHAATVPSLAKDSWLSSSKKLDEQDGANPDKAKKTSFLQAVRKIQARRLFEAKIYIANLFERLVWLTYRLFVSSHMKDEQAKNKGGKKKDADEGKEKDDYAKQAAKSTRGFLRRIAFLKNGHLDEFDGEDNYLLLVRALFPELPYSSQEILRQAGSKNGLRLDPLEDQKIVDFPPPPGLQNHIFDLLYTTRKTSWCHYYEVDLGKVDKLQIEDLFNLALDYERELWLLEKSSSQQDFEKMDVDDGFEEMDVDNDFRETVLARLEKADEQDLRDKVREIVKCLRHETRRIREARMTAYKAVASHPNLDATDKTVKKETLQKELRENGVKTPSSASRDTLFKDMKAHVHGTLQVKKYKSPNHESLRATPPMPELTATGDFRGAKDVLETQNEFLIHYNLFTTGLEHLFERGSQLRRAQFFDRLSRPEGYKFACDECGSTDSLHLVHECGHILCYAHIQNKKSCGDGSTRCTSRLGNFAVPISDLAVSPGSNDQQMGGTDDDDDDSVALDSKIRTVIELIRDQIPQDEKVVVFTQYKQILGMMKEKLNEHGIDCVTTTGTNSASDVLENFKQGKHKALVMRLNSSEAAGGNLVVANHVIFVSPLVENSQHRYTAHMRQATGRCIREGQEKTVHVYHCVTEGTIEPNILEMREGKEIVVQRGEKLGKLVESPRVGVPGGLRSTLSKAEVWRAMDEQDYATTIGMKDGQVEFSA